MELLNMCKLSRQQGTSLNLATALVYGVRCKDESIEYSQLPRHLVDVFAVNISTLWMASTCRALTMCPQTIRVPKVGALVNGLL